MKNNILGESVISILLIALLIFFLNPLELTMPKSIHTLMVPLLLVVFVVLAGLVWKEGRGDERDGLHKFIASRFAYFASVTTLFVGISVESFQKAIDPWLIIALCIILLGKIIGLIYGYFKF